jgi:hypothetical protein
MSGKCTTIKCITFLSEQENKIPQCALRLNSALVIAENWNLKGYMLKVTYAKLVQITSWEHYFMLQ